MGVCSVYYISKYTRPRTCTYARTPYKMGVAKIAARFARRQLHPKNPPFSKAGSAAGVNGK